MTVYWLALCGDDNTHVCWLKDLLWLTPPQALYPRIPTPSLSTCVYRLFELGGVTVHMFVDWAGWPNHRHYTPDYQPPHVRIKPAWIKRGGLYTCLLTWIKCWWLYISWHHTYSLAWMEAPVHMFAGLSGVEEATQIASPGVATLTNAQINAPVACYRSIQLREVTLWDLVFILTQRLWCCTSCLTNPVGSVLPADTKVMFWYCTLTPTHPVGSKLHTDLTHLNQNLTSTWWTCLICLVR